MKSDERTATRLTAEYRLECAAVRQGNGSDIAWQGKANPISMQSAILAACDLLGNG